MRPFLLTADVQKLGPAVHFQRNAIGGDKNTVTFEEIQHKVFSKQHTAASCTQQSVETVRAGLKICQTAEAFSIQKKPFNLKIPAATQQFRGTATLIAQQAHRLARFGDGREICHFQSFVDMKRPKISFPVTAAIIVKAVSQVAALLDFSEQNTGTDFMNRSCRNKEEVILMNGNMVKTALYRAAADCIANLGGSHGPAEAVNNFRLLPGMQNIPQLRFPGIILMQAGIVIIRMYLNGQFFLRIDQFDENREFRFAAGKLQRMGAQHVRLFREKITELCTGENAGGDE